MTLPDNASGEDLLRLVLQRLRAPKDVSQINRELMGLAANMLEEVSKAAKERQDQIKELVQLVHMLKDVIRGVAKDLKNKKEADGGGC